MSPRIERIEINQNTEYQKGFFIRLDSPEEFDPEEFDRLVEKRDQIKELNI